MELDKGWFDAVFRWCDPVFKHADVGFEGRSVAGGSGNTVDAFLWEAQPRRFVARYPDSGLIESYGEEQWAGVPCIDYWIYVEPDHRRCRVSVEGWNLTEFCVETTGNGNRDGVHLASLVARILQVPWPLPEQ